MYKQTQIKNKGILFLQLLNQFFLQKQKTSQNKVPQFPNCILCYIYNSKVKETIRYSIIGFEIIHDLLPPSH